jgi:hypothetical protein
MKYMYCIYMNVPFFMQCSIVKYYMSSNPFQGFNHLMFVSGYLVLNTGS